MTFNTGNPIGSTDARDRSDNSENMDILENSTELNAHPDRLGIMRKTRKGMELEHDNQIAAHEAEHDNQMQSFETDFDSRLAAMAFTRVGSFTSGATLTDMRQVLVWEVSQGGDGHEYGWAGAFPKVVAAGATPATSGGIGAGAWVDRTDVTLRGDINIVVKRFASVSDMVADASLQLGQIVETLGYYGDWVSTTSKPKGGNRYEIVAAATGTADSGAFISLSNGLQAKGLFVDDVFNVAQFGAKGDGVTNDTLAFLSCSKAFNLVGHGTYLIPPAEYVVGMQLDEITPDCLEYDWYNTYGGIGYWSGYKATLHTIYLLISGDTKIIGDGAKLKVADGLYVGMFNMDGTPSGAQNMGHSAMGSGYTVYVRYGNSELDLRPASEGTPTLIINGIEVDGSDATAIVGSGIGDIGMQAMSYGVCVLGNCNIEMNNVYAHHYVTDGIYTGGAASDQKTSLMRTFTNCRAEFNGRNNLLNTGGTNAVYINCKSNYQGQSAFCSLPHTGYDFEYETGNVNETTFYNCEFVGNKGSAILIPEIWNRSYRPIKFINCIFEGANEFTEVDNSVVAEGFNAFFDGCSFYGSTLYKLGILNNKNLKGVNGAIAENCYFTNRLRFAAYNKVKDIFGGNLKAMMVKNSTIEINNPVADIRFALFPMFLKDCECIITGDGKISFSINYLSTACEPFGSAGTGDGVKFTSNLKTLNPTTENWGHRLAPRMYFQLSGLSSSDINLDVSTDITHIPLAPANIAICGMASVLKGHKFVFTDTDLYDHMIATNTGSLGLNTTNITTTLGSNKVTATTGESYLTENLYIYLDGVLSPSRIMVKDNNDLYMSSAALATATAVAVYRVPVIFTLYYKPQYAATVKDVSAIAAGTTATFTVSITTAALGDIVYGAAAGDLLGCSLSAVVTAAGIVTVTITNPTASSVDLPSMTYNLTVIKAPTSYTV